MEKKEMEVKIHLGEGVTEEFLSAELSKHDLQEAAPDEFGELALDPLSLALVVGGVNALAHLVVSVWKQFRGGTVVDLTGDRPSIYADRDVPHGWMLVIAKDGKVTLEAKEVPPDGLERIVEKVLDLGVGAPKALIEAAVGGSATPGTERADSSTG